MRSEPIKESKLVTSVSFRNSSHSSFLATATPRTLLLPVQVLCLCQGPLLALLPAPHQRQAPLTLPLMCPSQIFSFEINISVAIITFASKPKVILPILHKNSRDVTEVINHLDNINYKGIGVIK